MVWCMARGKGVPTHVNEFLRGDIPREVEERVRAITLDAVGDPSRAWWVARIMSELDIHRSRKV